MGKNLCDISISKSASLVEVLRKMDASSSKLLIVLDNERFVSVVSIGDVQRTLIQGHGLETQVSEVLRKEISVASPDSSYAEIKRKMHLSRIEFMPVVDEQNNLHKIHFWDEMFSEEPQPVTKFQAPVVVMAGGMGTRLRPLSNILPKPLFPVNDHTILEEIFERFHKHGCEDFWLSVNYKAELIRHYVDEIENRPFDVRYFQEDKPLGTAGSLYLLRDKIGTTFFVSNCDILIDTDYGEVLKSHQEQGNEITLISALKEISIPYGTVQTGPGGALEEFREKPNLNFMINTGLYVLEPSVLKEIPEDSFFHITHLIEQVRNRGGKVGVFPVSEKSWLDIGDWREYGRTMGFLKGE